MIPFSRKREVILGNKIRELKRVNRELVLRLKNYKGTDLVELSLQHNREEIMQDLYTVEAEQQMNQELHVEMESLLAQLAHRLQQYLGARQKGKRMEWTQEECFLLELAQLSERIGLTFLDKYHICPLPESNQTAVSVYSVLEEYKESNRLHRVVDSYGLNLELSKENAELACQLQEGQQQMATLSNEVVPRTKGSKNASNKIASIGDKVGKLASALRLSQQRANFTQNLLIQNLCHTQLVRQWVDKAHSRLSEQLDSISLALGEVREIVAVGEAAKESLFLYLHSNLPQLEARFPNLKLTLRQVRTDLG